MHAEPNEFIAVDHLCTLSILLVFCFIPVREEPDMSSFIVNSKVYFTSFILISPRCTLKEAQYTQAIIS